MCVRGCVGTCVRKCVRVCVNGVYLTDWVPAVITFPALQIVLRQRKKKVQDGIKWVLSRSSLHALKQWRVSSPKNYPELTLNKWNCRTHRLLLPPSSNTLTLRVCAAKRHRCHGRIAACAFSQTILRSASRMASLWHWLCVFYSLFSAANPPRDAAVAARSRLPARAERCAGGLAAEMQSAIRSRY